MRRPAPLLALGLIACLAPAAQAQTRKPDAFRDRIQPILDRYCVACHSAVDAEGSIALDRFDDQAAALKGGRLWIKVRDAVEGHLMPPVDARQPRPEDREAVVSWVENDFLAAQCGQQGPLPPVVIRRLNRQEYDNTIRDLLGLDLRLAQSFPADDIGFGFDNVGSALNVSPAHVERYLDAAEVALDRAIATPDAEPFPPIELIGLRTYPLPKDKPVEFAHTLKPGLYQAEFSLVRVGISENVPPPRLLLGLGKDRRTVDAIQVQDETVVYRYWLKVAPGDVMVHVSLAPGQAETENVANPKEVTAQVSGDQRYGGKRGMHVDSMVVRGPVPPVGLDLATHKAILSKTPEYSEISTFAVAKDLIGSFAQRAYRRPLKGDESERIFRAFRLAHDRGESFERSVQVALTSVLASPQFLFLVEPRDSASQAETPLDDFELASRLSYFLWSSMPDEELFAQARAKTLRPNLAKQVGRMIKDPKSDAFVTNFAGQWLQLRKLGGVTPDPNLFPSFDDKLRVAMRGETEAHFAHIVRENRSALELIDCDYTFLNEPLATHYGIPGVKGDAFRKVALPDRRRGGVLTQASVLTLTSNPNRTSPVKRGQFILQQILGTPPPPPPPDVPKLEEGKDAAGAASLRERMELHRTNPECAACHQQMDPLGFALENYDAVGRFRLKDGSFPIDPSGSIVGGQKFADAPALKSLLAKGATKKFARCLIENMLTYALGRGLDAQDFCTVEDIRHRLEADGFKMQTIVLGIVEARAFQNR